MIQSHVLATSEGDVSHRLLQRGIVTTTEPIGAPRAPAETASQGGAAFDRVDPISEAAVKGITARTVSGAAWLVAARLGTRAIDFVTLLLLANVLLPGDFGMVAVALTLVQIIEAILEIPVGQVLVRSHTITRDLLDAAFTIGLLRGIVLAVVIAICAEPFAILYHDVRLAPLICFLGVAPAARGLTSPAMTHFAKAIDFRRDLLIELSGKVATLGCSVSLAVATRSYWAIAFGTVAGPMAMLLLSYAFAPYRPRLSLAQWRAFAHFVGWSTAAQLVNALNWQIGRLLLGRFVSKADLGAYSLALDIAGLPEQSIVRPIGRPLLSAFAALQHDHQRLVAAYARTTNSILTIGLPVMLGLSLLAEPAVRLALGAKWQPSWPILQWLALAVIPPLLTAPLGSLAMVLGRTEIFLRRNLIELAVSAPLFLTGAYFYGTYGVVAAHLVIGTAMAFTSTMLVRRLTHIPVHRQLSGSWRTACAGGGLTLVLLALRPYLHGLTGLSLAVGLIACAAIAVASYAALLLLLWRLDGEPPGIEATLTRWVAASWPTITRRASGA
nr:lipopolysaccharide biosynthesis protein [Sphingomonas sp. CARO-RG-8B-R24-01]